MLSDQTAFISIVALVAIWLVCKFCENLALRVWIFIAIILGFVLGADGDFWQFIFLLGIVLLGYAVMPIVVLLVWAVVLAILRYGFKQSITR